MIEKRSRSLDLFLLFFESCFFDHDDPDYTYLLIISLCLSRLFIVSTNPPSGMKLY